LGFKSLAVAAIAAKRDPVAKKIGMIVSAEIFLRKWRRPSGVRDALLKSENVELPRITLLALETARLIIQSPIAP
jgi:hypothetical protein